MIRISLYFSLALAVVFLSACKQELSFDDQFNQVRQARQDLLFQMMNDTDGLGPNGESIDILQIDLLRDNRTNEVDRWPVRGFNEQEGVGALFLNLSINSGDFILLKDGKFEIVNANPTGTGISQANYRIEQDLEFFETMTFLHPDEEIDVAFFEMHIFEIDQEAREIKLVLIDDTIPGNVTVSLSW